MAATEERDVYDDLLDHYLTLGQPVPNLKESKELVQVRFTEEEAQVAMQLPSWYEGGISSKEIAERMGGDVDEIEKLCDRKAHEGVFFARVNKDTGEAMYALWDFGRLAAMYEPGRTDELFLKVKELKEKLWQGGHVHNRYPPSGYPMSRVIPYAKGIAEGEKITSTDTVEFTVEKARTIAIAGCPCRVVDQRCDYEVMNCVHFDDMADYFVKYHNGSYVTEEECKDLIEKNVEDGLVTTLANYQELLYGYCLCEPCCCVILRPLIEENNYHSVEKSNCRPRFNLDNCTRCEKCLEACPVDAIGKMPAPWGQPKKEDKMFLFEDRCIGCGVCVAQCQFEALKLYRVNDKAPEKTRVGAIKRHAAERMA